MAATRSGGSADVRSIGCKHGGNEPQAVRRHDAIWTRRGVVMSHPTRGRCGSTSSGSRSRDGDPHPTRVHRTGLAGVPSQIAEITGFEWAIDVSVEHPGDGHTRGFRSPSRSPPTATPPGPPRSQALPPGSSLTWRRRWSSTTGPTGPHGARGSPRQPPQDRRLSGRTARGSQARTAVRSSRGPWI